MQFAGEVGPMGIAIRIAIGIASGILSRDRLGTTYAIDAPKPQRHVRLPTLGRTLPTTRRLSASHHAPVSMRRLFLPNDPRVAPGTCLVTNQTGAFQAAV